MAVERIDSIFDISSIEAEYDKYQQLLKSSYEALDKLFVKVKEFSGANLGNLGKETEDLSKKIKDSVTVQSELEKQKQKLAFLYTDEAKQIAAVKLQQDQANKSNKQAAIEVLGLDDAYSKLNKEYLAAQRNAKNIGAVHGQNSDQFKKAAEHANVFGDRLKALDAGVGQNQRNVGNYASALEGVSHKANEFIGELAGIAAGAFTVEKAFEFLKDSIKEFGEAEVAAFKLKNTLQNAGRVDLFEKLTEEAEALSREFGTVTVKEVENSFQRLAVSGKVSADQIRELEPVIINFAANSGKSIDEATELIIRGLAGQRRGLKGYSVDVKDSNTAAQNFAQIMQDLAPKVAGSAKAFGDTLVGEQKKVDVAIEELKIKIGAEFAPILKKGEAALLAFVSNVPHLAEETVTFFDKITFSLHRLGATLLYIASIGNINLAEKIIGEASLIKFREDTIKATEEEESTQKQLLYVSKQIREEGERTLKQKRENQTVTGFTLEENISQQETLLKKKKEEYDQSVKQQELDRKPKSQFDVVNVGAKTDSKKLIELAKEISYTTRLISLLKEQPDNQILNKSGLTEAELAKINAELAKLIALRDKLAIQQANDQAADELTPIKIRLEANREALALELKQRKDVMLNALDAQNVDANQRKAIELEYAYDVYTIQRKYAKTQVTIIEQTNKKAQEFEAETTEFFIKEAEKRLAAEKKFQEDTLTLSKSTIEDTKNVQLIDLQKQYISGIISLKKFEEQKKKIDDQATLDTIAASRAQIKARLAALPSFQASNQGERAQRAQLEAADTGLQVQAQNIGVGTTTEADNKKKKILAALKELGDGFIDFSQSIIDDGYIKQLNYIQKLIDANEELQAAEVKRIEQSTLSEQDKAAKITVLNASYAAQQETLARKQRQIKHDQAVADKEFSIAKAIEDGIVAVVAALKIGPPLAIPLAAITAGIVALNVGKLIATPVPAYKEGAGINGKPAHKGGLAVVGDAGERELIQEPYKIPYWSADRAELRFLAAGTKVTPKKDVEKITAKNTSIEKIVLNNTYDSDKKYFEKLTNNNTNSHNKVVEKIITNNNNKNVIEKIIGGDNYSSVNNSSDVLTNREKIINSIAKEKNASRENNTHVYIMRYEKYLKENPIPEIEEIKNLAIKRDEINRTIEGSKTSSNSKTIEGKNTIIDLIKQREEIEKTITFKQNEINNKNINRSDIINRIQSINNSGSNESITNRIEHVNNSGSSDSLINRKEEVQRIINRIDTSKLIDINEINRLINRNSVDRIMSVSEINKLVERSVAKMHIDQHGILKSLPKEDGEDNNNGSIEKAIVWQTQQLKKELRSQKKTTHIKNSINLNNITYIEHNVFK